MPIVKEISQDDLLIFRGKIEGKSTWSRGMMISYGGFSREGLEAFKVGKSTNMIGMDSMDIWAILDEKVTLNEAIEFKARRAAETNDFFVPLRACSGFWFDGENELKFTPMRRKKRSVSRLCRGQVSAT